MKYFLHAVFFLVFLPGIVGAQTLDIASSVTTELMGSGTVVLNYNIPEQSELLLFVSCRTSARFFVEQTGAIISCGDDPYMVPNPGEGGRIKIVPYDVDKDTAVTYKLSRTSREGDSEILATQSVDVKAIVPVPLFSNVSVRQDDPRKARVTVEWKTLEKANIMLTVGCDSQDLVLVTEDDDRYACNEPIELAKNTEGGVARLSAENHSVQEGLLFTFVAMRDGEVGALKNISFTFETTTEQVATGETEQSIINRLVVQVKMLLQVVASLFK